MAPPAPLSPAQTARLITALRHGQALEDAATHLRMDLAAVWATARTHTGLTIALAGRDPQAAEEAGRIARAEYLRLLALGLSPSRAELIMGAGHPGGWRSDPAYAQACTAVAKASAPYAHTRQNRLTPERVARFLERLREPGTTVLAAAASVGVSTAAIYQRRRRDVAFGAAMDEARAVRES